MSAPTMCSTSMSAFSGSFQRFLEKLDHVKFICYHKGMLPDLAYGFSHSWSQIRDNYMGSLTKGPLLQGVSYLFT